MNTCLHVCIHINQRTRLSLRRTKLYKSKYSKKSSLSVKLTSGEFRLSLPSLTSRSNKYESEQSEIVGIETTGIK